MCFPTFFSKRKRNCITKYTKVLLYWKSIYWLRQKRRRRLLDFNLFAQRIWSFRPNSTIWCLSLFNTDRRECRDGVADVNSWSTPYSKNSMTDWWKTQSSFLLLLLLHLCWRNNASTFFPPFSASFHVSFEHVVDEASISRFDPSLMKHPHHFKTWVQPKNKHVWARN